MIDLSSPVEVALIENNALRWRPAVVVGRTMEQNPRYDVRLADGAIKSDIPATLIKRAA